MIKRFLKGIFFKASNIASSNPEFVTTHNRNSKSDFEVSELSYDEYIEYAGPERRVTTAEVETDRRRTFI